MKKLFFLIIVLLFSLLITFGFKEGREKVYTVDIGTVVSDLEKSFEFYTKILGMQKTGTWHASREMSVALGINNGKAFDIIDLKLECEGYILKYKLNKTEGNIQKDKTSGIVTGSYSFENPGTRYLTVNVKSVDPFILRLKENDITFKMVTLPGGRRVLLFHDPDGALLEIGSDE